MLDINKIRENKEEIKKALLKRMDNVDLDFILELDDKRKKLISCIDEFKAERNKFSKTKPSQEIIENMKSLGEKIKGLEENLEEIENEFKDRLSSLPNIPADDVSSGGKENNKVIYTYGKKSKLDFEIKNHIDLASSLDLIDYERATKMSGSGFWAYKGNGALLEWALLNYFKDFHDKNKYSFLLLPYLLNRESAYASGHLPKFKEDLFWTDDDKLCLNATSEMMILNYHRDEIIDSKELPLKYYAYSPCFRKEAGAYRSEERGMMRGHQFNKIEMFQFTEPENSWRAFEELKRNAEKMVEGLGLHFQTSLLAAGDASAAMSKTIDIEIYFPSLNIYKEVSSVSNGLDYQARRANIRFSKNGKKNFVHTLNASGLATSRLLPAILEQNQMKDGSVVIPKVLRKYLPFKKLTPKIK
ncbi:MAG: serine--tRNA ligase [Patescibacteria group bacterium]|nr:serine--tRNA ligase [Patescibacteria group bacterium]MDD4304396.1 serine--tRNA ligase [Patescibacteria group bacterium]MDD4695419.1 serine--tRNA ligase [Patescibacteria group bacterium]